jgi:YYY domain-containing protein
VDARTDAWYPTKFWFWWQATRVIDGTIAEFPFFSFLLGDLHPHVMAIPLVLLAIALAMSAYRGRSALALATHRRVPAAGVAIAVLLGGLAFQNAWDVITFSGVFVVAVAARNLRSLPAREAVVASAGYVGPVAVVAALAYLPWLLVFDSQAGGIYPYVGRGTDPVEWLLQFGAPLAGALALLAWAMRGMRVREWAAPATFALWMPALPLLLWGPLAAWHGDLGSGVEQRGGGGWLTLLGLAALTWALATAFVVLAGRRRAGAIPVGLAAAGILLLYGAELFFVRDVFFGSIPRLNTFFKLGYQAWLLLALAGAVGATLALARAREGAAGRAPGVAVVAIVALGMVYPVLAVANRTEGFGAPSNIDGLAALAQSDPAEFALARWVEANVAPGAVVVEAHGDDYSNAGRVSSRTGRPAPIGWYFHEIQWRGDSEANRSEFRARQERVDRVYGAATGDELMGALDELSAEYVVVGRVEMSRYAASAMPDFGSLLDLVFESGDVRVYRVPVREVMSTT